jgi:hypothetical protein
MKRQRLGIAGIMALVAIAAVDLGAVRALDESSVAGIPSAVAILLVYGAVPMANVLALGVTRQPRPQSRPFLFGFVVFGALALAVYAGVSIGFPYQMIYRFVVPVNHFLAGSAGRMRAWLFMLVNSLADMFVLALPQVLFALVGGLVCQKLVRTVLPAHTD